MAQGKKSPVPKHGAPFELGSLTLGDVHVVADHTAKDGASYTADHCTLELVTARYGTDRGTCCGTDGSITLRVLHSRDRTASR